MSSAQWVRRFRAAAAVLIFLATGCGSGAEETFTREDLDRFLFQPEQLPEGYQVKVRNDATGADGQRT